MVSYSVSITNLDSSACPSSTFSLAGSAPAGWTAVFTASSLSLQPGASASTTLRVTSPTSAAAGTYQVTAATSGPAAGTHVASGSASYTVMAARSVQLVSGRTAYLRSDTVTLTARVLAGTVPVAGTSATFRIVKADGKVVSGSASTDAQGYAVYRLRFKVKDPLGTWQATASSSGATSPAVSFAVNR